MNELPWNLDALPEYLHIKVTPKSSCEKIIVEHNADGSILYKIYLTAIPADGKANQALIAFLAKELKIAKSRILIMRGLNARHKIVKILPSP